MGSLNGAMFALDLYETARDMWLSIRSQDVMELPEENADLSEPVSYTHLDVYKRQMMNRSCTPPPTGPFSSCRETLNTSLRPSTAVSSLSRCV